VRLFFKDHIQTASSAEFPNQMLMRGVEVNFTTRIVYKRLIVEVPIKRLIAGTQQSNFSNARQSDNVCVIGLAEVERSHNLSLAVHLIIGYFACSSCSIKEN